MLPPGLFPLIAGFLDEPSMHAWAYFAGVGRLPSRGVIMRLVIDGLQMVYKDRQGLGYGSRNLSGVVASGHCDRAMADDDDAHWVWQKPRTRMIGGGEWPPGVASRGRPRFRWNAGRRHGRAVGDLSGRDGPGAGGFAAVARGAAAAAVLWWFVSWAFGVYMRSVRYRAIYGGLEVAIGLMIWMELTAIVILIGAAYNAECAGSARQPWRPALDSDGATRGGGSWRRFASSALRDAGSMNGRCDSCCAGGFQVAEVEDRWYSPGMVYFRFRANDGNFYILRHVEGMDAWSLVGFRASRDAELPRLRRRLVQGPHGAS